MRRIDTLQNRFRAAMDLLELASGHITDLHDIAYNRHRAQQEERVHGGSVDYALDTHGSQTARELYRDMYDRLIGAIEDVSVVAHDIVRFVKHGDMASTRRDKTADVTAEEVVLALAAKRRRSERGEHHPKLNQVQPTPKLPVEPIIELATLREALRKMHPGERPDDRKLTPLEREAWLRAVPPGKDERRPRDFDWREHREQKASGE